MDMRRYAVWSLGSVLLCLGPGCRGHATPAGDTKGALVSATPAGSAAATAGAAPSLPRHVQKVTLQHLADLETWSELPSIYSLSPHEKTALAAPAEKAQLPFGSFAGADGFFCGALTAGPLRCWGKQGDFVKGAFTQVAATRAAACGLQVDGAVTCVPTAEGARFGALTSGELGDFRVRRLAAGAYHVCALRKDERAQATEVRCFGPEDVCPAPQPPSDLRAKFFAVGDCHACAADEHSKLSCWGKTQGLNLPPAGTLAIDDLAAGDGFVCALLPDGSPQCWGSAPALAQAKCKAISAAGGTVCTKDGSGAVRCVGETVAAWTTPVTRFAVGRHSVCAQLGPRDIRCVGAAESSQLEPPLDSSSAPTPPTPDDAARLQGLFTEFLAGFAPATMPLRLDRTTTIEIGDRIAPRFADFVREKDESDTEAWRYGSRIPTGTDYAAVTLYRPSQHCIELRTFSNQGSIVAARCLASYSTEGVPREEMSDGTAREGTKVRALESVITEQLEVQSTETIGTQTVFYVKPLASGKQPESKRECAIDNTVWTDALDARGKPQRKAAKVEPVYHATDATGCGTRFPLPDATSEGGDAVTTDPCAGSQTILVDEIEAKHMRVVETRLSGERLRTVLEQAEDARPAIDLDRQRAFGLAGFTNLQTNETRAFPDAKAFAAPEFVASQPWVVSVLAASPRTDPAKLKTRVLDYATGNAVTTFDGYAPNVAPDGSVLFLRAAERPDSGVAPHVDIMRWDGSTPTRLKRVAMSEEGGPYGIDEVIALSRDRYVYRVYDEHEYRYYDQNDAPFFKGVGPVKRPDGFDAEHKEQYDLTVSKNRRRAAFTERDWNELTYLVVLDLANKRRIATHFYGSFPAIYGDYVAFVSDPSFVRGGNVAFRQIRKYAVYAYHVPTGTLCEVAKYSGAAQPH